jgi:hypothetical protein
VWYLLSVHGPAIYDEALSHAFNERLRQDGHWVFAGRLAPATTATVVDCQGTEPVLTDGPYLESRQECMSGFWVIEAPDLDVALRLAAEAAATARRGKVEVRPFKSR